MRLFDEVILLLSLLQLHFVTPVEDATTTQNGEGANLTSPEIDETEPLWRSYLQCESSLGRKSVTCDPDNRLQVFGVRKKIDDILWSMQTDVPCYCDRVEYCKRYDDVPIQSGVVAVLVSFFNGDLPDDVDRVAERIYQNIKFTPTTSTLLTSVDGEHGASTCENGLVFIYAFDTRTLFLYPGSALSSVFDYLPIHRRRIEPTALSEYLENVFVALQKKAPESVAIRRVASEGDANGSELVIGMIAAVIVVSVAGAALVAVLFTKCFRGRRKSNVVGIGMGGYEDELENYEKECREWTKRARYMAKQRSRMMRSMQKPNWEHKVEAAKRRLSKVKTTSMPALEPPEAGNIDQQQQQQSSPYYIVSEPSSVYNVNFMRNWSFYDDGDTMRNENDLGGTSRGDAFPDAVFERNRPAKRETQSCDFYFQDE